MRHRKAGRRLGRNAEHRLALMRNLTMALILHERIITTVAKAKEVRPFVEKLITLAKKGTLHSRRLAMAKLGPMGQARPNANAENENERDDRKVLTKLFEDIAPRFKDRPGGYTRIIKRHERRLGDAGQTAFLELLKEGETKVRAKAPAPAPRVEPTPPAPAPQAAPPAPAAETPAPPPPAPEQAPAPPAPEGTPPQTPPAT
jgi:large subunit ribosomal protein L17